MRKIKIIIEGNTNTESVYETKEYRLYINNEFIYTSDNLLKVKQKVDKIISTMFLEENLK